MSDPLCRLATGGGFATRKLFSDSDEVIIDAVRPIILNGITNGIIRPDLAERAISLNLPAIANLNAARSVKFWPSSKACGQGTLGALLDALSRGIAETSSNKPSRFGAYGRFRLVGEGVPARSMAIRQLSASLRYQPERGGGRHGRRRCRVGGDHENDGRSRSLEWYRRIFYNGFRLCRPCVGQGMAEKPASTPGSPRPSPHMPATFQH